MSMSTRTESESKFDWSDFIVSCYGHVSIYIYNLHYTEYVGRHKTYSNSIFQIKYYLQVLLTSSTEW
jgi:hypothetical protein